MVIQWFDAESAEDDSGSQDDVVAMQKRKASVKNEDKPKKRKEKTGNGLGERIRE